MDQSLNSFNTEPATTGMDKVIFGFLTMFLLCTSFSIALTQIGYFTALTLWIGRMVYQKSYRVPSTPLDKFFAAYIVSMTLSLIFSYDRPTALMIFQRRVLLLPIVYVILANIQTRKDLERLFLALLISAVGVALWGLRDLALHFNDYIHFKRRLGDFQIYMTAGGIMMIASLLMVPFVVHRKTPKNIRILALVSLVPVFIDLFFTFTRSSWLGFLAGLLVIGIIRSKKILLPALGVILLVLVFSSPEVKERVYSIVDPSHPNNVTRVNMWKVGMKIFADHPLVGVGDIDMHPLWYQYSGFDWAIEGHLHNNVVMWLVTLGALGFIVLIGFFITLWRVFAKIEKKLRDDWLYGSLSLGGLAVFAGFHINGLFEWNFGDAEIIMLLWAITGMVLAADKVSQKA